MITLPQLAGSLILVRQTEHAAHSGRLADAWRRPSSMPIEPWRHLIEAVQRHDDGWIQAEQCPALDPDGRPYDFKDLPSKEHISIWRRGVDLAEQRHCYQALLVAQHARSVYVQFPKATDQKAQQAFIDELTQRMAGYIRPLAKGRDWEPTAVEPHNLCIAQRLVSFFDGFSLALLGGLAWMEKSPSTRFGDHEAKLSLIRNAADDYARVGPWPFQSPTVSLRATLTQLNQCEFADAQSLASNMQAATTMERTWLLEPASGS